MLRAASAEPGSDDVYLALYALLLRVAALHSLAVNHSYRAVLGFHVTSPGAQSKDTTLLHVLRGEKSDLAKFVLPSRDLPTGFARDEVRDRFRAGSSDHLIEVIYARLASMGPSRKMGSLLRSFGLSSGNRDPLATKARSDGFFTAKGIDALFVRTASDIDGEDCLRDCESCTIKYPRKFEIDESDALYGEIKGWSRHLIVATGKSDWVRDVEDEKGSVMEAVGRHMHDVTGGKLMLSASNIPVPDFPGDHVGPYGPDRPTTAILLPSFKFVDNLTPHLVPDFLRSIVNTAPTNTTALDDAATESHRAREMKTSPHAGSIPSSNSLPLRDLPAGLTLRDCPHKYLILLCSQATRDARCGQSAPLLRRELERHLRPLGLYRDLADERPGGVGIYFISHVGGHKYSANMMVYRRAEIRQTGQDRMQGTGSLNEKIDPAVDGEAAQCIWLARVRPEDCENIVRYTVLQGKVVKPDRQLRGGFDRARGVVSW